MPTSFTERITEVFYIPCLCLKKTYRCKLRSFSDQHHRIIIIIIIIIRKMGYMEYLLQLWNKKGYEHLDLSAQNLVDVANQAERKARKLETCISHTINEERIISNTIMTNAFIIDNTLECQELQELQELQNTECTLDIDIYRLEKLVEHSEEIFNSLNSDVGDFSKRNWKTKFRSALNESEINYIDKACLNLILKKNITDSDDKLMSLWLLNCIVYSVIV